MFASSSSLSASNRATTASAAAAGGGLATSLFAANPFHPLPSRFLAARRRPSAASSGAALPSSSAAHSDEQMRRMLLRVAASAGGSAGGDDALDYDTLLAMEEFLSRGVRPRNSADASMIGALPQHTCPAGSPHLKSRCLICRERVRVGDALRTLPCIHSFHVDCIDQVCSAEISHAVCCDNIHPTCVINFALKYFSPRPPAAHRSGSAKTNRAPFASITLMRNNDDENILQRSSNVRKYSISSFNINTVFFIHGRNEAALSAQTSPLRLTQ